MTGADHRFLDLVGRIFGNRQASLGRGQQHHAAAAAGLEGRGCVLVDESFLDRCLVGPEAFENLIDLTEQDDEPLAHGQVDRGADDAVGDVAQAVAVNVDDPPTGVAKPGIETENAHSAHALSRPMTPSATSKFAQTLWTSSLSS